MTSKLSVIVTEGTPPSEDPAPTRTVRRAFPRPPLFFLPRQFWLPGARPPPPSGTARQGTSWPRKAIHSDARLTRHKRAVELAWYIVL